MNTDDSGIGVGLKRKGRPGPGPGGAGAPYSKRYKHADAAAAGPAAAQQFRRAAPAAAAPAAAICGLTGCDNHPIHLMTLLQCIGLSLADTLHDAAGGYRNKVNADALIIKTALMRAFNRITAIRQQIAGLAGECETADLIPRCLVNSLNNTVIQSNIEDSTISYFESNIPYLQRTAHDAKITYADIIALDMAAITVRATADRLNNDSFRILPGAYRAKALTPANKTKIALYIIVFLLGLDFAEIFITFDAGQNAVGHIFRGHAFVKGLYIPQNVGDSAISSFKQLGAEPDLYVSPSTHGNRFYVQRNILSNDLLRMFYQDNGFCKKCPFKISFGLEAVVVEGVAGPPASVSMSYETEGYTQGPSLDYLIDLMRAAQVPASNYRGIPTSSSCLRIGDVIQESPIDALVRQTHGGVFMDIKRGGDQDVGDAILALLCSSFIADEKYVIGATIDRLCSLLYRLLGIPCIYQYGDELTLYKNSQTDRTLDEGTKRGLIEQKNARYIEKYSGLVKLYKSRVAQGNLLTFICSFREHIREPAADTPPLQILRRNKIVDIYERLRNVYNIITREAPAGVDPILDNIIEDIVDGDVGDVGDVDDVKVRKINKFFRILNVDAEIDTKFLLGLTQILEQLPAAEGVVAPPINPTLQFNQALDYGYLNYSTEAYADLTKAYYGFDLIKNRVRVIRDPINYDTKLNKEDGYNTLLKVYTNTFYNALQGADAYNALLFKTQPYVEGGPDPAVYRANITMYEQESKRIAALVGESAANQALRREFRVIKETAINASHTLRDLLNHDAIVATAVDGLPVGCPQIGGAYQKGGAYSENHVNLFKDICERAALFINSEIGRIYPNAIQRYAVDQFVEALEAWQAAETDRLRAIRDTQVIYSYAFAESVILADDVRIILEASDHNNIPATIAALKAGRTAVPNPIDDALDTIPNIDDLLLRISDSRANDMLTELFMIWSEGIRSDPAVALDNSHYAISVLLDPYSVDPVAAAAAAAENPEAAEAAVAARKAAVAAAEAAAAADPNPVSARASRAAARAMREEVAAAAAADVAEVAAVAIAAPADPAIAAAEAAIEGSQGQIYRSQLKLSYPLLFSFRPASINRQKFLKKLLGSDQGRGITNRVIMYSLITLAFFDDLFKGNVGKRTSLLISRLGSIPANASKYFYLSAANWNRIPEYIQSILIQINNGKFIREAIGLMYGGAHSNKYRHTRRRYSRSHRVTRRKNTKG
jgi:hypothetical protein